jgi:hypothetical protein
LQQIIGKPPANLATLRAGIQLNGPAPAQIDTWVDSAEKQNYGVISQQLSLEFAQRDIKKNRAGHAPTLDLVASRNHTTQSGNTLTPTGSTTNTSTVGVQWNMPIFSGFAITSKVRESIALEDKARNDLESARRTAAQGARQSYFGVNSGLAQVKALEAADASSKLALESNKLGYQVGVRINIDVLNAQQQVYATQRDLAKARYDTIMNGLRLKSAAGTLKEDDVRQVNELLMQNELAMSPPSSTTEKVDAPSAAIQTIATIPQLPAAKPNDASEREAVLETVSRWARAWSAQDVPNYLGSYAEDFRTPNGSSRENWEKQRRNRITNKNHIDITVESPKVTIDGNTATVNFRQVYQSDSLTEQSDKILVLTKRDGNWKIQQERSGS